ncbi:hypothetical protein ACTTPN_003756 [Escherichia coli]
MFLHINPDWASAIAAFGSAIAAFISLRTSKKLGLFDKEKFYSEALINFADRVNKIATGKAGSDWDVNDASNIILSLNAAKETIESAPKPIREQLKQYYKHNLCHEIITELEAHSPPDSVIVREPSEYEGKIMGLWNEIKIFLGYTVVSEADLED